MAETGPPPGGLFGALTVPQQRLDLEQELQAAVGQFPLQEPEALPGKRELEAAQRLAHRPVDVPYPRRRDRVTGAGDEPCGLKRADDDLAAEDVGGLELLGRSSVPPSLTASCCGAPRVCTR